MPRIPKAELHRLRNDVDVTAVIQHLDVPTKQWEGHTRFLCPACAEFHTATNPATNLARCFRCERNYNPIDLVIAVERVPFLDAVRYLQRLFPARPAHTDVRRDPQKA